MANRTITSPGPGPDTSTGTGSRTGPGAGSRTGPGAGTGTEWAAYARNMLGRAGHHRGAARDRVIDLLAAQACALSALEIEDGLRRGRRGQRAVGRASIYRVLDLLHAHDLVSRVDVGDGLARYEPSHPAGEHHHHHLVCEQCGKLVAFDDPGLERAIDKLSDRLGVRVESHEVLLRGACDQCD